MAGIKTLGQSAIKVRALLYTGHDALVPQLLFNACFAHPAVIIKRSVLLKENYSMAATHAEDYDLWTRLAQQGVRLGNFTTKSPLRIVMLKMKHASV
ncbi:MAG: hypothetical protein IPM78_14145 [Moraxellaceae bacterium]|nr:hypothetical protein [Moraxellaceae bacterium]